MPHPNNDHEPAVLAWLAGIAKQVGPLGVLSLNHGDYMISEIKIAYDGDPTQYSVVPSELRTGEYMVNIERPEEPKKDIAGVIPTIQSDK